MLSAWSSLAGHSSYGSADLARYFMIMVRVTQSDIEDARSARLG